MELLLQLGVSALKVGSDDFTNIPLLKQYSATGLPLLISCGMANLGKFIRLFDVTGAMEGKPVVLMLCTSQYPTPVADVNLSKLKLLRQRSQISIGIFRSYPRTLGCSNCIWFRRCSIRKALHTRSSITRPRPLVFRRSQRCSRNGYLRSETPA